MNNFNVKKIQLGSIDDAINTPLYASEFDSNGRELTVQLLDGAVETDTTGYALALAFTTDKEYSCPFDVVDITKGTYKIVYPPELVKIPGTKVKCALRISHGNNVMESKPFNITIAKSIYNESQSTPIDTYMPRLTQAEIDISTLNTNLDTTNDNVALKAPQTALDATNAIVATKATTAYVDTKTQANNLSFKESFATLALLQSAYPSGDTYNHCVLSDGMIYTYKSGWVSTQVLANGTGIANGIITRSKIASDVMQSVNNYFAKSYIDTITLMENEAFRGWLTPFKVPTNSFSKIKYYSNITSNSVLTCQVLDSSLNVLYETTKDVVVGTVEEIIFDFGQNITLNAEFYIFIFAPTNTIDISFIGSDKQYNVLSETLSCKAIFKTTSGNTSFYDLGVKTAALCVEFISTEYYNQNKLIINESQIIPERVSKTELDGVTLPPFIYTSVNDMNNKRNYYTDVFLDHFLNTVSTDEDLIFKESGKDSVVIASPNGQNPHGSTTNVQTENVKQITNIYTLESVTHKNTISIMQRSVKSSLGKDKKAFILCIGDSITMYGADKLAYWGYLKMLFEMDKIDNGDVGFQTEIIGSGYYDSWDTVAIPSIPINYNGTQRTVRARAEGVGNWSLLHHMRWNGYGAFSQSWWDTLGLGDGTHTDFTGTETQLNLIRNTCQVDASINPTNVFFDNAKTGTNRFSILKWLERNRTMDDDGNRLTWGDSRIGTTITTVERLNSIDVCTPTHIILMHGRNTMLSPTDHASLVEEFIGECKSQVPTAKIGICLHPDQPGTYFPKRYGEILNTYAEKHIYNEDRPNQYARMVNTLNLCKNRESENVFLVPCWFSQPSAYGMAMQKITSASSKGDDMYKIFGDDYHPSGLAHMSWAYQIYCWIKYTQSL